MKTFIVFYNRKGKKKIAIDLNEVMSISQISDSLSRLIESLCARNGYTFNCHNLNDSDVLLRNLPIIPVGNWVIKFGVE